MYKQRTKCIYISIHLTYSLFNWLFTFWQNSMSSDTTFGGNIQGSADKVKGASVSGGVSGSISNGIATKDDR